MLPTRKINLNRLEVFLAVVEAGSLTAGGRRLGLTKSVVSTHISRLETEVGTALLLRSTRSISLTAAGRQFFEACTTTLQEFDDAVSALDRDNIDIGGLLRITTSADFGAAVVTPIIVSLINQFPNLKIELLAVDQIVNIVAEGIDVAVRLGWLRDSSQQATHLGEFSQWLVASPSWLDRVAAVRQPTDLMGWPFVELSILSRPETWTFLFASSTGFRCLRRVRSAPPLFRAVVWRCCPTI
jgi:DNA-binding transcriptional LysR family regulator